MTYLSTFEHRDNSYFKIVLLPAASKDAPHHHHQSLALKVAWTCIPTLTQTLFVSPLLLKLCSCPTSLGLQLELCDTLLYHPPLPKPQITLDAITVHQMPFVCRSSCWHTKSVLSSLHKNATHSHIICQHQGSSPQVSSAQGLQTQPCQSEH